MQQVGTGRIRGNGSATTATSETASAIPSRESYSPPGKISGHSTTPPTVHSNSSAMSESSPALQLRPNNLPATCIHSKISPTHSSTSRTCARSTPAPHCRARGAASQAAPATQPSTTHHPVRPVLAKAHRRTPWRSLTSAPACPQPWHRWRDSRTTPPARLLEMGPGRTWGQQCVPASCKQGKSIQKACTKVQEVYSICCKL